MKRESNIVDIDAMMDERFGAAGTEKRDGFRKEAYNYCVGQLILDARKQEHFTQTQLADRLGTSKSYISRIEKGQIEPGVGMFLRIINALGLRFEIVKPMAITLSDNNYNNDRKSVLRCRGQWRPE